MASRTSNQPLSKRLAAGNTVNNNSRTLNYKFAYFQRKIQLSGISAYTYGSRPY
jgi:hypothetical protein